MASQNYKAWSVGTASTSAFTVCFMVWMMFAVIGIPIKETLKLNETQFGILVALPVLTGSLIRLPLGMWTDKFGGRIVFFILMLSPVIPIWMISYGTQLWHARVPGCLFVAPAVCFPSGFLSSPGGSPRGRRASPWASSASAIPA